MVFCQVNRFLNKSLVLNTFLRLTHTRTYARVLVPLQSRQLLRVSGKDATEFLQGLITNDMKHFEEGTKSMYAMFLNNKGRVLYDTLIYKWESEDSFLIECDKDVLASLQKHLKIYKLKRDVQIVDMNRHYNIWGLVSPVLTAIEMKLDPYSEINIFNDPRLIELGSRIIAKPNLSAPELIEIIGSDISVSENEDVYKYLRYKLGVSEGVEDMPPGTCFPLEMNCDYLHGVSFHKGCYIGQELTARIYHTGVVRKRIMPIKFLDEVDGKVTKDSVITDPAKPTSNLGKLKSFVCNRGIGLIRIREALEAKKLIISNYPVEILKPTWWPVEAPKEKISSKDAESQ